MGKGHLLEDPVMIELAKKYSKTPAQIAIRWSIQVFLLRENIYSWVQDKYILLDVRKFKNLIVHKTKWSSTDRFSLTSCIYDFVLTFFINYNC